MKMVEISYRSKVAELEKLNARLERAEKAYEKKLAAAKKVGGAEWTKEQRKAWVETVETKDGWMVNKEDIKKNGAWFDMRSAQADVEEVKGQIERAEARLEKAEQEVEKYREQVEKIADLKEKEKLFKLEFEKEQKEWAKDGIELQGRYYGKTPSGKGFNIEGNCGMTERSRHCYTLYIDGETVFTSGEFWRAYGVIKNR